MQQSKPNHLAAVPDFGGSDGEAEIVYLPLTWELVDHLIEVMGFVMDDGEPLDAIILTRLLKLAGSPTIAEVD